MRAREGHAVRLKSRKQAPDPASFTAWSDRVERRLRKCVLALVILLVAAQAAMQSPVVRSWLSPTERAEGIVYDGGHG